MLRSLSNGVHSGFETCVLRRFEARGSASDDVASDGEEETLRRSNRGDQFTARAKRPAARRRVLEHGAARPPIRARAGSLRRASGAEPAPKRVASQSVQELLMHEFVLRRSPFRSSRMRHFT